MASISFRLDKVNTTKAEQPVMCRYSHKPTGKPGTNYVIGTGVAVLPEQWKDGLVINHPNSVGLNRKINLVRERLAYARDNVIATKREPVASLVKEEYQRLLRALSSITAIGGEQAIDAVYDKIELNDIDVLEAKIAEHRQQIRLLEAQVEEIKRKRNEWTSDLLAEFVAQHPTRKGKTLSDSTVKCYDFISRNIKRFKPDLRIQDVTDVTLYEFQDYLIKNGTLNSTIELYISKIKGVLNYQKDRLGLTNHYKDYSFDLQQHEENVIALDETEIVDLLNLQFDIKRGGDKRSYERARDYLVLMASTGLRYSDIFIKPTDIKDGMIIKIPIKTKKRGTKVYIPLNPISESILEKYDYKIPPLADSYFNNIIKLVCQRIPSLHRLEKITVMSGKDERGKGKNGKDATGKPVEQPRYNLISSHTGRRTYCNILIDYNVPLVTIMAILGWTSLQQLTTYADKRREMKKRVAELKASNVLSLTDTTHLLSAEIIKEITA